MKRCLQRSLVLLLVGLLTTVTVGCSVGTDDSSSAGDSQLTASELGWIRAYSDWTLDFYDYERAGPALVRKCQDRLEGLGAPPTGRLELVASQVSSVCALLAQMGMRRRALDIVGQADDIALAFFRDEQPLELDRGETDQSRADVALSEVASERVERPVEVRCWNETDWRRVVAEDNAWTDDDSRPEDLVGWSDDVDDRIHIVLDQCNTMSRVEAADDIGRWNRDDRIDAADSIETLAHEIEHFLVPDAEEAVVECRAIRSLPLLAQRFGVTSASANELEELYRTEIYPDLDEEYTDPGCPR